MPLPRSRRFFPEVVSGYPLVNYDITLVAPAAAANLVANPSVERDTTGWSAMAGAIARSSAWQRRGSFSLAVTPTAALGDGCFYGTVPMTGGSLYAMSVDILGAAGVPYALYFGNTIAQRLSPLFAFTATGKAQRPVLNWAPPATSNYRCYIVKNGHVSTKTFFVDGLQVELAPASTYFDGDLRGFIANQQAYYWTGTPHASASARILATRSGGVEVNLSKYGFSLLAVLGLGLTGFVNQFTPSAALGGSQYDGTLPVEHVFDLVGALTGRSHLELQHNRSSLERLLRPNAGILQQPLLMRIQSVDDCGDPAGETVEIPCTLEPGSLAGQVDNDYQERVDLQFKIFLPYVAKREGEEGASLNYQTSLSMAYGARRIAGQWQTFGAGFNNTVTAIAYDPARGRVYYAGLFTTANNTTVNRITYWDLATNTFAAMDSGVNGEVDALCVMPNGDVYTGGKFTTVGSAAAATKGLARWNIATGTWTAITNTSAGFVAIYALVADAAGNLYGGGDFTTYNGVPSTARIWKFDGTTFSALGSGMNGIVYALARALNGTTIYVGGAFTTGNGLTLNRVGIWGGTTFATFPNANPLSPGVSDDVRALTVAPNGLLYVGGKFLTEPDGLITYNHIGVWNGASLMPMGVGTSAAASQINTIFIGTDGLVYAAGTYTTIGGLITKFLAAWNGTSWVFVDMQADATTHVINAGLSINGDLYIGSDTNASVLTARLNTLTNTGSADAFPILEFLGPGTVYMLVNYTTGDALYFNLTLLAGERATLDLRPGNLSFVSTFRGDIVGTILPGSNFGSWHLAPGANNVSAFVSSVSSQTTLAAHWAPTYLALEDALYTP